VIYCPTCGKGTRILNTRTSGGVARRRRECPLGHRTSTEERVVARPAARAATAQPSAQPATPQPAVTDISVFRVWSSAEKVPHA
jgi:hypothetical protein